MALRSILKEMEINRVNAEMDLHMGSEATYGSRLGLKRAATETLSRLKTEYRDEFKKVTAFIVVTGSAREAFTQLASNETFQCFSADPDEFYKNLVSRIDPSLYGRESTNNLFKIANNVLYDKLLEIDILSDHMILFSEKYNRGVKDATDFLSLVREAINDQVGSEVVGINAIHSIIDEAIKGKYEEEVVPIVLSTSDEKFALDLQKNLKRLKSKVFLVVAGKASKILYNAENAVLVKTVSEESVKAAFDSISSKM